MGRVAAMSIGLIGRKVGMTQVFQADGTMIPVSVVAVGPNVRSVEVGDHVLFEPEDRGEVELQGIEYVLLRERDVHAVAAHRNSTSGTGLYL